MGNFAVLEQGSTPLPARKDQVDAGIAYSTKVTKYFDVLGNKHTNTTTVESERGDILPCTNCASYTL
jgi:hypothetical protein